VTVPPIELDRLIADLAVPFPQWLRELFEAVPLCGIELGWQAYEPHGDYDGIAIIEWSDARGIRSESLECYPGCAVRSAGYVNVGGDGGGGGDPYFVSIHEGEDPPLYQIYHDVSDQAAKIIAEARRVVSPKLSEFLASARVTA
jgi:hypothetical protein